VAARRKTLFSTQKEAGRRRVKNVEVVFEALEDGIQRCLDNGITIYKETSMPAQFDFVFGGYGLSVSVALYYPIVKTALDAFLIIAHWDGHKHIPKGRVFLNSPKKIWEEKFSFDVDATLTTYWVSQRSKKNTLLMRLQITRLFGLSIKGLTLLATTKAG
jgi:hypothetical protein